jgi:hypothetical protein
MRCKADGSISLRPAGVRVCFGLVVYYDYWREEQKKVWWWSWSWSFACFVRIGGSSYEPAHCCADRARYADAAHFIVDFFWGDFVSFNVFGVRYRDRMGISFRAIRMIGPDVDQH